MRSIIAARTRTIVGGVVAATVVAAACGYQKQSATVVQLKDPGKCVAVDVAAAPETAPLLNDAASRFNGSPSAKLRGGGCAFVRVHPVDSPVAGRELLTGWPDADRLGPPPVAWVPGSTMWGELLNAQLTDRHRPPMAPNGTPFAHTPLVIAMPQPMAAALGYPRRPISWDLLAQLAHDPRGWGVYGHPDWGPFRLGKGNPFWSTTGLDQTIALDNEAGGSPQPAQLEQSVVYYSALPQVYFDNWKRLAKQSPTRALEYVSAVVTDERTVVAYNTGHDVTDDKLVSHATRPRMRVVAVYPSDATIESDNPIIVLHAPWASEQARAGARLFTRFALQPATQEKVAAAGFRPSRGEPLATLVSSSNGVDAHAAGRSIAPASPGAIEQALAQWETNRRPARVLLLVDVSDSMGDQADPDETGGPTKLAVAQAQLAKALGELGPADDVGLRIFTTGLRGPAGPAGPAGADWRDLVAIGPIASRRAALVNAIAALHTGRGSPLYAAIHDAFDTIAEQADREHINSVVLLTDGYNEDEHDTSLSVLLAHLATRDVRVFTISYSNDADMASLQEIADTTNAWNFDARDTHDLQDLLPRALAGL